MINNIQYVELYNTVLIYINIIINICIFTQYNIYIKHIHTNENSMFSICIYIYIIYKYIKLRSGGYMPN